MHTYVSCVNARATHRTMRYVSDQYHAVRCARCDVHSVAPPATASLPKTKPHNGYNVYITNTYGDAEHNLQRDEETAEGDWFHMIHNSKGHIMSESVCGCLLFMRPFISAICTHAHSAEGALPPEARDAGGVGRLCKSIKHIHTITTLSK